MESNFFSHFFPFFWSYGIASYGPKKKITVTTPKQVFHVKFNNPTCKHSSSYFSVVLLGGKINLFNPCYCQRSNTGRHSPVTAIPYSVKSIHVKVLRWTLPMMTAEMVVWDEVCCVFINVNCLLHSAPKH